jgi:tyrosyl-tRNA synthetase
MKNFKSELLIELQNRGFLKQVSDPDGLDRLIKNNQITGYIGFDLTAPSLHVGSLLQIMLLRWFQKYGNKPLILLGSGTTMIGDPSGKDDTRKMLSERDIATNKQGILKVFNKFINLDEGKSIIADNKDWLNQINYIDFLRDFGQHFTINRMMSFDSVRLRLEREQPLTFIEFNYMILQAYDFVQLNRIFNCKLQMGGSDQWGNMVNGIELGRRVDSKELFALTTPLITTSSGTKMGKSVNGAVWLDEDLYSPYDYWQYWRNTEDADVGRFLKFFTDLPLDEIRKL